MNQRYMRCLASASQCDFVVLCTVYGENYMLYNSIPLSDKQKLLVHVTTRMGLKCNRLNKRSQPEKKKSIFCRISFIENFYHTMVENRSVIAWGGMIIKRHDKTFGGVEMFNILIVIVVSCVYLCLSYQIKFSTLCMRNLLYKVTPK